MKKPKQGLPTREQILAFIETSDQPAGKREIARAFGLVAQDKIALKALLKDMGDEGLIDSAPGRAFHRMGGLPRVTVLRVADVDDAGTIWAVPERWEAEDAPPPRLRVRERKRGSLGIGDRVLARTEQDERGWTAHPMKTLPRASEQVLGVLREEGGRLWLTGVEKKERREFLVADAGDAGPGDLVLAEKAGRPPRVTVRVTERLGDPFAPRSFSLIAIHRHEIPDQFKPETLEEATRVAAQPLGDDREDLRALPIVAIDPADARDHDDAVWAAPDDDPANPGGWKAVVAIADVSFYVRPGSALDQDARRRGNSVYFPDRVVPMLPEILSAEVCSLKEGENRAALACHLQVGRDGTLKGWRFSRAVVRIAANIAYEDAQAAIDGTVPHALTETALRPLWDCWAALAKARDAREPLDLDLPERRVVLDEKGRILSVAPRERLDAHRLIEDYMIAANVAAAKALEARKAPVMYRVHEPPSREKLAALKDYLETFDVAFTLGQVIRPATFNRVLERVGDADFRPQVMEQVLRTQTQAYYAPANHGHFGLSLGSYAHFTSPIRRYADLVVHRALVAAYALGPGGVKPDPAEMDRIGEGISRLERRAMEAERETIDRYVAAYLSEHIGSIVEVRVTGVQNYGLFATVEGIGGDGLLAVRDLGGEYFRYDESARTLTGEDSGDQYTLGQRLSLRLAEANPVSGALRFELPEGGGGGAPPERDGRRGRGHPRVLKRRGRPGNIRHNGRRR
ncbi:ribonuclease R family protein [Sphingomonas carotinifaciens]|uniref:Ribonuclease R n=1 Tax=Sphingomonas carotinifaciens TaxID=1166323 RepID=A0A1G7KEP3_9SPHN|nr:VacB/RNase II family 3'-5' exoribonuclease [Sphingomonas carotinifaciens]MBB4085243.1 ribonuclease R [Sphingomonas carotinifaciens]MWC43732.1 VacB/RNase II family 3'-5' exoribonuclease [Sphingomonas carotinifaciens]SDF35693.1 RNAse R [Sphingomonas carotinifaciens]